LSSRYPVPVPLSWDTSEYPDAKPCELTFASISNMLMKLPRDIAGSVGIPRVLPEEDTHNDRPAATYSGDRVSHVNRCKRLRVSPA
jgi:hypothetical protein